MDWKIYYGDGTTFSRNDGDPGEAPARDVQVIAQSSREHGWTAWSGRDYYIWRDGQWFGVDLFGLYDYLVEPGWKRVLFGRTLVRAEYDLVWQRMMADPELPEKTAFHKGERRPG